MLKINLLPTYIYEKRKVRQAGLSFCLLFAVVIVSMLSWRFALSNNERKLSMQVEEMKQKAAIVDAINAQIPVEQQKTQTLKTKVDFIEAVMNYNLEYPALFEELAKYTYSRIQYMEIKPSATDNTIQISAYARSVGDCGRYLLNMYRAQHLFSSVIIDSGTFPHWESGNHTVGGILTSGSGSQGSIFDALVEQGFTFNIKCTLIKPIVAPTAPGPGGAAGTTDATQQGMPAGGAYNMNRPMPPPGEQPPQ